jgi:hypothetical protein
MMAIGVLMPRILIMPLLTSRPYIRIAVSSNLSGTAPTCSFQEMLKPIKGMIPKGRLSFTERGQ